MAESSCVGRKGREWRMGRPMNRKGYTLLELMLALALTVFAVAIIGNIMQMYANNFTTRGEDIRRVQLARALLNMIAEDIRSVLTEQKYDGAVLEQLMGSAGGGAGGGGGATSGGGGGTGGTTGGGTNGATGGGTGGTTGGGTGGDPTVGGQPTGGSTKTGSSSSLASSSSSTSSIASSSSTTSGAGATGTDPNADLSATTTTAMPVGLHGTQYQLLLDVSRLPRPDEYLAQQNASVLTGNLVDVPGDVKTVCYYVQAPTNMGVRDTLADLTGESPTNGTASGLVRRQLDRAVASFAEAQGQVEQMLRSGDLVAPEVISIEFMYFDGTQWLTTWDSSTQSLPWLIQISLAMQSARGEQKTPYTPGTPLNMIPFDDRAAYGIEVYDLIVAIPGAQLQAADAAASAEADAGMESVGL